MLIAANIAVALIAVLHVYILLMKMFLWDKPAGLREFGHTPEIAKVSKVLTANQGLYNSFLAAGLFWGLMPCDNSVAIKIFFLSCVLIAGLYDSASPNPEECKSMLSGEDINPDTFCPNYPELKELTSGLIFHSRIDEIHSH